ncbi:MAG: hypothetical protein M0R48_02050 [Candidatus Omnitrophica bacterium]|jgi:hypothetical protein|nr:hypothetical protein [Candidatus Omnitrophota bacterium]
MANGKHGDHPLTDILIHKVPVFSTSIDKLITEIARFIPNYKLREMFNWFSPPPLPEFEKQLKEVLDKARQEAKEKGWELNHDK